ncbi:GNAT family N-acetyltransferase [Sinorhizobium meliloti]|uniref:GNAT family N-acetyltransferase n=1 Tax=Rhizobium meliloti TaxID=382 RepID=UPI001E54EFD8|nr:GNAT family N-acetyltransferase [Sinorhizobium meliloti]UFX13161.1 GNAT family N-acetyltransferase [Sinorhizobium meliloti]
MNTPSQKSDQHTAEGLYRIRFYKHYVHSPAWELVPQAVTYFEESGFTGRTPSPPMPKEPCMVAIGEDGKAIGMLIYACGEDNWHITLSYVAPEHRRKGIHTALFNALRDKAKEQGNIFSILSGTHGNNLAAQAAFEAQGRTKEYIMYSYPLKDRGDGKSPLRAQ